MLQFIGVSEKRILLLNVHYQTHKRERILNIRVHKMLNIKWTHKSCQLNIWMHKYVINSGHKKICQLNRWGT